MRTGKKGGGSARRTEGLGLDVENRPRFPIQWWFRLAGMMLVRVNGTKKEDL